VAILDEREGWGRATTGGAAGKEYRVTTLADSGLGSLRYALTSPGPLWIVFDVSGTISLSRDVVMASYKTIDGRGKQITIKGATEAITPIVMDNASNIIITGVRFDQGYEKWASDSEGASLIKVRNAKKVWIHKCTFVQSADGAIEAGPPNSRPEMGLADEVSVTWNRFQRHYQAVNLGASRASVGHNYYESCYARCPQVLVGKVHSYNNLIKGWSKDTVQSAKDKGQLFSQANMWLPTLSNVVNSRQNGGKIASKKQRAFKPTTFVGNDAVDETFITQSKACAKMTVPQDEAGWSAMRRELETKAGAGW
jgi:pectate lyase